MAGGLRVGAGLPPALQHEMAAATQNWAAAVAGSAARARAGLPAMPSRGSAPGELGWSGLPATAGQGFPYGMDREAAVAALLGAALPPMSACSMLPVSAPSPFSALVHEQAAFLGAPLAASPFDTPGAGGTPAGLAGMACAGTGALQEGSAESARAAGACPIWPPPRPPAGGGLRVGGTGGSTGSNDSEDAAASGLPDYHTLAALQACASQEAQGSASCTWFTRVSLLLYLGPTNACSPACPHASSSSHILRL